MQKEKNLESRRAASRRWRLNHPEKAAELRRSYERRNKEKVNARNRRKYHLNPAKTAARHRLRKYGISQEDFDKMLRAQGGRCAICSLLLKSPYVDHDHKTGKNRELLCRLCNWVLGGAHDSIDILEKSILYLKKHGDLDGGKTTSPRGSRLQIDSHYSF
jgi:hypothetical protein